MFIDNAVVAQITADLNPLSRKFDQAHGMARGLVGKLGSVFAGIGKSLASPLVMIGSAAAGLFTIHKAISAVTSAMQDIDAVAKLSDAMGTTTEGFLALRHQANLTGVDMQAVTMSVNRMQQAMVEAANAPEKAGAGFRQLGLDVSKLINLPAEESLGQIGDALRNIENPAQRAAAAAEIFGMKAGPQLLNLLTQGSAGIAAAKEEADRLGISFSRIDAAKVELANDAFTRLQAAVSALATKFAIELAPAIQAVTEKITGVAGDSVNFGDVATNSVQKLTGAIAYTSDLLSFFTSGWKFLQAGVIIAAAGAVKAIDLIGSATAKVLDMLPGVEAEFTRTFDIMADNMIEQAGRLVKEGEAAWTNFEKGGNQQNVTKFFDDAKIASQAAAEKIAADAEKMRGSFEGVTAEVKDSSCVMQSASNEAGDALDRLRKEVEQFGMSETQKRVLDFKGMKDATQDQIAQYEALAGRLESMKVKVNEVTDVSAAATEEVRNLGSQISGHVENLIAAQAKFDLAGGASPGGDGVKRSNQQKAMLGFPDVQRSIQQQTILATKGLGGLGSVSVPETPPVSSMSAGGGGAGGELIKEIKQILFLLKRIEGSEIMRTTFKVVEMR